MRSADARLSASTMISSSIRLSLVGAHVDCTTKTSRARTLVLISTVTSPSEKRPTLAAPSEMPRCSAISAASAGLALPVNTMKSGVGTTCIDWPSGCERLVPLRLAYLAGEEGLEPSHAGIKIQCLNQLGDSPTRVDGCNQPPTDDRRWGPIPTADEPPNCRIPWPAIPPERLARPSRAPATRKPRCPNPSSCLPVPVNPAI